MAAGEGPAKEPNRRVNMEAMVGNWFCCNKKRKEGVGWWWWEARGITLYSVDVLVLAQVGVIPDQSPMMLSDGECLLSVPCMWLSS
jgi:hypothetical protein